MFIIAVLVTAVAIGLIFAFSRRSVTAQPQITSIAVLPLANLSAGPEEFFADGMTEELITNLAKIKALSVIARTAVMRYRRTNKGPDEIARELGVQALVEGSVQRVGGRVRVTVRLIEPHNFTELWAENYERDAGDVLAMESEIARDIARTVHSRPTNDETELLVNSPSLDPHAMENYLESLQYVGGGLGPDAPRRALALLDKVIQREPRFAQAYATQAQIYYVLGSENFWAPGSDHNVVLPAAVAFTKGEEAAHRALQLNPNLAEAHYAMALVRTTDRDWSGALDEYRKALALNPSLASAHSQVALLLAALDRRDEALKEARWARQLDPLDESLGLVLYMSRRYEEAAEECRRVLLAGGPTGAGMTLSRIYLRMQRDQDAMDEFARRPVFKSVPGAAAEMRNSFASGGGRALASWLAEFYQRQTYRPLGAWNIGWFYAMAGDRESAFALIEQASEKREFRVSWSLADPGWDELRTDPRFHELLRRLNLPESLAHKPVR